MSKHYIAYVIQESVTIVAVAAFLALVIFVVINWASLDLSVFWQPMSLVPLLLLLLLAAVHYRVVITTLGTLLYRAETLKEVPEESEHGEAWQIP